MNREETKNARKVVTDIVYSRNLKTDQKVDEILSYMNSIVKRYQINERFDDIQSKKEKNLSKCCGCLSSPCDFIYSTIVLWFYIMATIFAIVGSMSILYFFVARFF